MAQYTTATLLSDVRTGAMLPAASAGTFSDADLLRLADRELQAGIVPLVMSVREEYFVAHVDVAVSGTQVQFRVPSRAIGGKLRSVALYAGVTYQPVPQIDPSGAGLANGPFGFYVEGNTVTLRNLSGSWPSALARVSYFQRPGRLVLESAAGLVQSFNTGTRVIACTPTAPGSGLYDIVRGKPGYECLAIDAPGAPVDTLVTMTAALPAELTFGDYVCNAEESPVPQIPPELHPVLVQRVVCKVLEALNDASGLQSAQAKLQELQTAALTLISPRVDGEPKRFVPTSSPFRRRWTY